MIFSFSLLWLAFRTPRIAAQGSITDYAPTLNVPCPQTSNGVLVRTFTPQTQALNPQEQSYIAARESNVIPSAWSDWVGNGSAVGYSFSLLNASLPRLGIALGGEGYRTAQFGAGVFSALDARNTTAKTSGTGGLLQVASYLAGSSGGSWLTASLSLNDWPSPSTLVYGDGASLSGWMLDLDLIAPSSLNLGDVNNQEYWGSILASVEAKANASIDTSITDLWGRAVSYHFLNQTTRSNFYTNNTGHGAGQLWSQIPLLPSYANQSMPFPIIAADSLPSGSNLTSAAPLDSVVYELTPLEFGSWDPNLSAMAPMAYSGTHLVNGIAPGTSPCVTGFDQATFMMGSSASIFNVVDGPNGNFTGFDDENGDVTGMQFLYEQLSSRVQSRSFNVANWPNAFQGVNPATFQDSSSQWLSLVDGGSNLEQIPLGTLFTKARAVDVIVAADASSDDPTNRWPNGTTLLTTSQRISSLLSSSHQAFPPIPLSTQDFLTTGVNQRPTFFGCNPTQTPPEYPLIIYIPNSPPLDGSPPASNTGDLQFSYTPVQTAVLINQAFQNTLGGFTPNTTLADPNWGKCLQCAALDRARLGLMPPPPRSELCAQCFSQYCYDPEAPPSANELPGRDYVYSNPDPGGLDKVEEFLSQNKGAIIGGAVAVAVLIGGGIAFIFWWRKRKERKSRYSRVDELREDDEPWKYYDNHSTDHEMHQLSLL